MSMRGPQQNHYLSGLNRPYKEDRHSKTISFILKTKIILFLLIACRLSHKNVTQNKMKSNYIANISDVFRGGL